MRLIRLLCRWWTDEPRSTAVLRRVLVQLYVRAPIANAVIPIMEWLWRTRRLGRWRLVLLAFLDRLL